MLVYEKPVQSKTLYATDQTIPQSADNQVTYKKNSNNVQASTVKNYKYFYNKFDSANNKYEVYASDTTTNQVPTASDFKLRAFYENQDGENKQIF